MEGISMSTGRRKTYVCFFILVFLVLWRQAKAEGFEIGVYGGAAAAAMGGYNDRITALNSYNSSLGASPTLTKFTYEPEPSLIILRSFDTVFGQTAVYLRNDWIILEQRGNDSRWSTGAQAQSLNGDFSAFYTSAGARYYYRPEGASNLEFYVDADAGLCHYYSNYATEVTVKEDGGIQDSIRKDWKTAIPAASIGAGGNWWMGGGLGLGVNAGYRIASGKVMLAITDIAGSGGASQGEDSVDYSGIYANAGIILRFGGDVSGKKSGQSGDIGDSQFLEITGKLYNDADRLISAGLFRKAMEKNEEAMKLSPDDERLTAQAKVIKDGLEKNAPVNDIGTLKEEAEDFRRLKQFQNARLRYLEIKAMEPENPYAIFYLKNFDDKAAQYLQRAKSAVAGNENEKALKAAAKALEYSPDDEQIKAVYASIVKSGVLKEQTDKMFNQAVDLFDKGEYEQASELWKEVLNLNPSDAEARQNMNRALQKSGDDLKEKSQDAKKAHDEAVKEYKIGNMDAAALKCEYVLRIDPDDLDSRKMLDDIHKVKVGGEKQALPKR
jgi:tetratricopeptide (TPR) repeat protein